MDDKVAKGANFMYGKEYILQVYGNQAFEKALDSLPEEHAKVWRGQHIPLGLYSFEAFKALAQALAQADASAENHLAAMYAFIASKSLSTLHKVFFKLTKPDFVIGNYPKLWPRFFTAGSVSVSDKRPGYAKVMFEVPEMFLDWLGPACRGYSEKAIELGGGRETTVSECERKRSAGQTWQVSYDVSWQQ